MTITDLPATYDAASTAPGSAAAAGGEANRADDGKPFALFGEDGFTFADLLDIVNPLQHIPIVGTLYRRITGDALDPGARLAGGALFGGPIGVAIAGANAALEDATGKDAGDHVLALFEDADAAPAAAVAEAAGGSAAVPDLALLGPLPAAAAPAPVIDLAALVPLAPAPSGLLVAAMPDAGRTGAVPSDIEAGDSGWFTQTMLAALEKYQDAARLAGDDGAAASSAD